MAPIATIFLIGNVYFIKKAIEYLEKGEYIWMFIFIACWYLSWIGTSIPLFLIGNWALLTTNYIFPCLMLSLFSTYASRFISIIVYPSKYIAGDENKIIILTLLTPVIALGWTTNSMCFDTSLYFNLGLFLFLAVLFVGTRVLRALSISDIVFDYKDDDDVVSLNLVKEFED